MLRNNQKQNVTKKTSTWRNHIKQNRKDQQYKRNLQRRQQI